MPKLSIFISSTFYDLKEQRQLLKTALEEMDYTVSLSEDGDVGYEKNQLLEQSCLKAVEASDVIVGIIGGRFGSESRLEDAISITMNEIDTALRDRKLVYIFVEQDVLAEYDTYKKNRDKANQLEWAHVDNVEIYKFLDELYAHKDVPMMGFEYGSKILSLLKRQLSSQLSKYINDDARLSQQKTAMDVRAEVQNLKEAVFSFKKLSDEMISAGSAIRFMPVPVLRELLRVLGVRSYIVLTSSKKAVFDYLYDLGFQFDDSNSESFVFTRDRGEKFETLTLEKDFFCGDQVNIRLEQCEGLVKLQTTAKVLSFDDVPF